MTPDIESWREMQREHNRPALAERFVPPAAPPALPPVGAAEAMGGEVATALPTQLSIAMAGVAAAPLARESKLAAQRRWRTAAIIAVQETGAAVQASSVFAEMEKLRAAEAVRGGLTLASMHSLQSAPALRVWLCNNKSKWTKNASAGAEAATAE
jgi:hypothetical protein